VRNALKMHHRFRPSDESESSMNMSAINNYCKLELNWILVNLLMADTANTQKFLAPDSQGVNPVCDHIVNELQTQNWVH